MITSRRFEKVECIFLYNIRWDGCGKFVFAEDDIFPAVKVEQKGGDGICRFLLAPWQYNGEVFATDCRTFWTLNENVIDHYSRRPELYSEAIVIGKRGYDGSVTPNREVLEKI